MPMPQPVRRSAVGQALKTLSLMVSGAFILWRVATVLMAMTGAVGPKAGPQPAARPPSPAQAALPAVVTPAAAATRTPPGSSQGREVSAQRAADGHYYFDAAVGSTMVRMLFDTGASTVALRAEDAARAGISVNSLNYSIRIQTANGVTEAAPIMLESLRVGDITRWNVAAVVSRPGKLGVSLLGQSFMSKLAGYRFERGEVILQIY